MINAGAEPGAALSPRWVRVAEAARTIVPNTQDINTISRKVIGAASAEEIMPKWQVEFYDDQQAALEREEQRLEGLQPESPEEKADVESRLSAIRRQQMQIRQQREQMEFQMEASKATAEKLQDVNVALSVGSSLAFEAVIVLLAMWRFSRKDY
jgi:hypothetical protein